MTRGSNHRLLVARDRMETRLLSELSIDRTIPRADTWRQARKLLSHVCLKTALLGCVLLFHVPEPVISRRALEHPRSGEADGGYQGPVFQNAAKAAMESLNVEIVKRSDQVKGSTGLPNRFVVERIFASLNPCCRLAKDWEGVNRKDRSFVLLALIRPMVRRLGRVTKRFRTESNASGETGVTQPPSVRSCFLNHANA